MSNNTPPPATARSRTGRWRVFAVVLTVLCLALVVVGVRNQEAPSGPNPAVSSAAPQTSHLPKPVARRAPGDVPAIPAPNATPERLQIPAIAVDTNLIGLGVETDQTVQVPEDPDEAGWFKHGPQPGTNGSSVILGHVDSMTGPAVFYRLRELVPGDRIRVRLSDGALATFRVDRVATYANEDFPAQRVYAGSPDHPALNLVTCGGKYDPDKGGYQSNVVAFTRHMSTTAR